LLGLYTLLSLCPRACDSSAQKNFAVKISARFSPIDKQHPFSSIYTMETMPLHTESPRRVDVSPESLDALACLVSVLSADVILCARHVAYLHSLVVRGMVECAMLTKDEPTDAGDDEDDDEEEEEYEEEEYEEEEDEEGDEEEEGEEGEEGDEGDDGGDEPPKKKQKKDDDDDKKEEEPEEEEEEEEVRDCPLPC